MNLRNGMVFNSKLFLYLLWLVWSTEVQKVAGFDACLALWLDRTSSVDPAAVLDDLFGKVKLTKEEGGFCLQYVL